MEEVMNIGYYYRYTDNEQYTVVYRFDEMTESLFDFINSSNHCAISEVYIP
jgi:hypothetical protein